MHLGLPHGGRDDHRPVEPALAPLPDGSILFRTEELSAVPPWSASHRARTERNELGRGRLDRRGEHSSSRPGRVAFETANGDVASTNVARISHRLLSAVSSFRDSNSRARSLLRPFSGASWLQFCFGHDPARDAYRATRGGAGPRLRHAVRSATCSPSSEVIRRSRIGRPPSALPASAKRRAFGDASPRV